MGVRRRFTSLELLREELVFTSALFGSLSVQCVDAEVLNELDPSPREIFRDAYTLESASQHDLIEFVDSLQTRTCRGEHLLTRDALAVLYSLARHVSCEVRSLLWTLHTILRTPCRRHLCVYMSVWCVSGGYGGFRAGLLHCVRCTSSHLLGVPCGARTV